MAVHEKTGKWFTDCMKREKHRRNKYSLKQEEIGEKKQDHHLPAYYSHCCYCTKVFYDAKFLVKHVLRRHSDKLVELHKNMLSQTKSEKVNHEMPDLYEFLKAEFSDLKVEVDYIKKAFADYFQNKNDSMVERKSDHQSSNNKKSLDTTISTKNDSLKYEHAETCAKVASNQILDEDFKDLQTRVDKLFQMFRETVVSKEEIEKTLALNEDRICKTLKNELLTEIQSILSNHQKQNRDEYEAHYLELQREVNELEKVVQLNSKKIESPDCLHKIQSNFDSRIQNLLTGHTLFTLNAKRNKSNKIRNSNDEQKLSLHKPKRKIKSVYTSKTVHNESSDLSGNDKNKFLHSTFNQSKNQKHCEGTSFHINGETILFPSECNQLEIGEQENINELGFLINDSENFTEKDVEEINLIIEDKFKSLNIDTSTKKLSNEQFEKKMRLINSEKELLEKKYENFSEVYDELEKYVNEAAKSKLNKKLPKRLRFSDSLSVPSPDSIDCDSAVKISRTAQKQESSGFLFDRNAQGDSLSYKNFDVKNLPPIQENGEDISEGLCTGYAHQSTTQQHDCYESIKNYIPSSPVEDPVVEKSTASLLQKSVEEMSDLSSLESDIFEDECNLKGAV